MANSHINKIILISALVILLIGMVNSEKSIKSENSEKSKLAYKCPKFKPRDDANSTRYIIIFKNDHSTQSEGSDDTVIQDHFDGLKSCFGKHVEKVKGPNSHDQNVVTDFTIPGSIAGYTGMFTSDEANELSQLSEVAIVEEDVKIQTAGVIRKKRDLLPTLSTYLVQLNPPPNLNRISQASLPLNGRYRYPRSAGNGVNVYVIDTSVFLGGPHPGININNTDFGGRAHWSATFCKGCPNFDDHGHGTNIAGIIGGSRYGVAKKVNLFAIKALNSQGGGDMSTFINSLTYVLGLHQKSTNKNTIVNLSIGTASSPALKATVESLINSGIHVVAAAGNGYGADACSYTPSNVANAVVVGSTEINDIVSDFSNRGSCITLFAPGRNVVSDGPNGKTSTLTESGTSQSTPHAAGAIALVISKSGNKTPKAMKDYLIQLSTKNVIKGLDSKSPNRLLRIP
ncbi:6052_t:CDS:2 [Acaulospora morrowiae]|uniref:6052_t:CDS:1 n=1 Tax=Acaulospora morrowiae TaxID=94023 RepID=A0A9N9C1K4_9GLOM|nr:6052_t:CDS:2 [Acaulospora morrowiae]